MSDFNHDLPSGCPIVGSDKNGNPILGSSSDDTLEKVLLRNSLFTGSFYKFMARIFGNWCIGTFKPIRNGTDYQKYFLVWCGFHKKYSVTYAYGYEEESRKPCEICETEYRESVKASFQVR